MSKATKRQRQKERRAERLRIEARLEKRRRLIRGGAFLGVIILIVAGAFGITRYVQSRTPKTAKGCVSPTKRPAGSPKLKVTPNRIYSVSIQTSEGVMTADLNTCTDLWGANNFITLANKGFYNNTTFHRVAKDFVIQGGDPKGDGSGGPGYTFVSELPTNGYSVGDLAWAKTETAPAGSAGSQFFILTAEPGLKNVNTPPYQYGQLGKLTSGLDVALKINALAPPSGDGKPTKEVKITKVTVSKPSPVPTTTTTKAGTTVTTAVPTTTTTVAP